MVKQTRLVKQLSLGFKMLFHLVIKGPLSLPHNCPNVWNKIWHFEDPIISTLIKPSHLWVKASAHICFPFIYSAFSSHPSCISASYGCQLLICSATITSYAGNLFPCKELVLVAPEDATVISRIGHGGKGGRGEGPCLGNIKQESTQRSHQSWRKKSKKKKKTIWI